MPELSVKPSLNTGVVDEVMAAARQRGAMLGATFTIAIVDDSATPRALFRMDSADLLTVGLALGKARLVASNGMPSKCGAASSPTTPTWA